MEQAPQAPDPRCQHCGTALTDETAGGLCPRCLLEMNFASRTMPGGEPSPQVPPPSPEDMAARFPQFEILECLGRGGMGIVYKARQKTLDRLVAIKVLAGERRDDPQFEARFEKEARTLAKLNHPNIVTVHDFGESDGMFYLVMEFVDGVNLRDVLRDGRMEPAQALAIVPEICAALQFAHDHGVVHRDIKPENILIDRDGRVKIADFGIAKLIEPVAAVWDRRTSEAGDQRRSQTAATFTIGTPPYMAPEQEAAGGTIDHRADIYALGVVLYEMLTGERPTKDLVAPSRRVEIDVRLDEIVLRALEKEPARRYQTAGEFRTVVQTMAASNIDRADGHSPEETTVHGPRETGPAEQEKNSGDFIKHIRILSASYQIIGVLLMIGAFIPPIVAGITLARDKSDWHEILPLMIAAIFAWPVGLGLGGFLVYLGNELRQNHRHPLCHVSAILLLVLSVLIFPPLAILAIYTLIVLKKDDVAKAGDSDMKPAPGFSSSNRPRGMFARFWWLFLGILALGPLISAMIGARMMPPTSDAFTETVILTILLSPLIALGLTASLHRFFPEPQPRLWTASVAGALVIALVLTMGFGIKFLVKIPTAALVQVPPGPVPDESLNTPEHAARSFMAAMRDGDIEAAMNWVAPDSAIMSHPDFRRWKTLREALKSISDELRQEAYAGELERLVQFTEWVPENPTGNGKHLVVGVAAPSKMTQPPLPYALYLILSSTPEGWRVTHFGDSAAGKSLVKLLEDFLALEALRHPVESSSPSVPSGAKQVELLDVDAHKGPVVLDLASGGLLSVPKDLQNPTDFSRHFNKLGKGDIAWDVGAIITLRGARLSDWLDNGWTLRNPESELDGSGAYRITVPARLRVTTAEGGHYIVDVREKISEPKQGVRIEFQPSEAPNPDKDTTHAIIGKWQADDGKTRIEFFSDGTMAIFDGSMTVGGKYSFLDDGRVKTEMSAHGTSAVEIIQVSVSGDVMTTIDEQGKKVELKRVRIDNPSADPPETGRNEPDNNAPPEAKWPQEGADIRRFVLELPVQPPLAVPKDLPLTLDQVKAVLKGVTWGKLLAALAEDANGDDIEVSEIPSPGDKNNRYEIAFSYETGRMLMELAVDWRFRSAEPSRLRPAEMPDKVLTHSSEFLPQLAVRYAMLTGHEAATPVVEEAKAKVRQVQDRKTLQQYARALMLYQESMGSFPPDLATLLDGDYPGKKPWENLQKDGLLLNHPTGKMERPIYHGHKDLRADDPDANKYILVAAPSADRDGKRLVGFLDSSVKLIDEADYLKQVAETP